MRPSERDRGRVLSKVIALARTGKGEKISVLAGPSLSFSSHVTFLPFPNQSGEGDGRNLRVEQGAS